MAAPVTRQHRVLMSRSAKVYLRLSRIELGRGKRRAMLLASGLMVGAIAVLMAWAADAAQVAYAGLLTRAAWAGLVVTPVGFALCRLVATRFFPGAQGSGIPQVIAARRVTDDADRRRLVSLRIAVGKVLLLLVGLLCGGSLGREGPTVQVGAAIMQAAGRFGGLSRAGLLLAGGAAGVAAAFNTPLAGIVFAIEELGRSFEVKASGLVLIAIVLAGLTAQTLTGDYTYFGQSYLFLPWKTQIVVVPFVAVIGGLAGGLFTSASVLFADGLPGRVGRLIKAHPLLTAAVLGLLVALAGWLTGAPIDGTGYGPTRDILHDPAAATSLWFGPAKFVATLATSLSGIPGGIFSPSLAIGAGIGFDIAHLLHQPETGAIALIGMVAYLSGVLQAPITSFVIVAEMTASGRMVLPLMLTALIATSVARFLGKEGLYHALASRLLR
jgi:H+/Cl- antiporter ClcA